MDPLQWMGAVKMSPNSWYKHHSNPHNFSPSIDVFWNETLYISMKKKSIIKMFSHQTIFFRLKYKTSTHNIAFCSEKVILSESGEKYAQIYKHWYTFKTILNKYFGGFLWDITTGEGLFHWRKSYGLRTHIFTRSDGLKLILMDLFLTNMQLFPSQD